MGSGLLRSPRSPRFNGGQGPQGTYPGMNPDEVLAAARNKVQRLERAIEVLGDNDSAEAWKPPCSSGATDSHPGRRVSSFHPTFPKPIAQDGARTSRRAEGARRSFGAVDQVARRDEQSAGTHTARQCATSSTRSNIGRAPTVASSRGRDGDGEGRVSQEARKIVVVPPPDMPVRAEHCIVPASSERQIISDGHTDQSWRDHCWKFESFQPVGMKAHEVCRSHWGSYSAHAACDSAVLDSLVHDSVG